MKESNTRNQRSRKLNRKLKTLSAEAKEELNQRILDDLESDAYEEFQSSEQSMSEFEDYEELKSKKSKKAKLKKKKKSRRDKRTLLMRSKVNLQQMI